MLFIHENAGLMKERVVSICVAKRKECNTMKKTIILFLCCGLLISAVGCGGNTAPPPTESPPTTASETVISETVLETTPSVTAAEPTEKEKETVPTESEAQATESTVTATAPTATDSTEETKTTVPSTAEEKLTPPIEETVPSTTQQLTESKPTEIEPPNVTELPTKTEPPKVIEPEPTEKTMPFDIDHWLAFAKEYAVSKGFVLSDTAVDCWDNPIRAGAHCIYIERDIQSRLDRYAKDEDITDVWIWAEATGNDCYDIYIGYA